jgi:hypothetical protein
MQTLTVVQIFQQQIALELCGIREPQNDLVILIWRRPSPDADTLRKTLNRTRFHCIINKAEKMLLDREFLRGPKGGRQIGPKEFPVGDVAMAIENPPGVTEMKFREEYRIGKCGPEQPTKPDQPPTIDLPFSFLE